ncbi:hypothetical protein ACFIOY_40130 [Bradyrhizobium sp. TZ2]
MDTHKNAPDAERSSGDGAQRDRRRPDEGRSRTPVQHRGEDGRQWVERFRAEGMDGLRESPTTPAWALVRKGDDRQRRLLQILRLSAKPEYCFPSVHAFGQVRQSKPLISNKAQILLGSLFSQAENRLPTAGGTHYRDASGRGERAGEDENLCSIMPTDPRVQNSWS